MRHPLNETAEAPTGITAFACQDYAGAFASAVVQEGFTIVGKVEQEDDFGMPAWMHNASFLARGASDFIHRSDLATNGQLVVSMSSSAIHRAQASAS
jgi:hypothetical protein